MLFPSGIFLALVFGCVADESSNRIIATIVSQPVVSQGFLVMPSPTNAVRFRLYTNAARGAGHLFNTFDIEAHGETLLQSPGGDRLQQWLKALPSSGTLHNVLVNGVGPDLDFTNGMTVIEQASGAGWTYAALDVSAAYRSQLRQWRRSVLFVEPDLFILHDHLEGWEPVEFKMLLHPPATAYLDKVWSDLRVGLPNASLIVHTPAGQKRLRPWERIESGADEFLPGTATMRLSPTSQFKDLDLLTVFAIGSGIEKKEFAFKLLQSTSAIGVRIHREGLPTLVAFKTNPAAGDATLTGFSFSGPVGVSVFKPKKTR